MVYTEQDSFIQRKRMVFYVSGNLNDKRGALNVKLHSLPEFDEGIRDKTLKCRKSSWEADISCICGIGSNE
jgi:hypothetical protein